MTLITLRETETKLNSEIREKTLLISLITTSAFLILFIPICFLIFSKRKSYKFRVADQKNLSCNQDFEFKEVEEDKTNNQMREAEEFIRIQENRRDVE